MAKSDLRKLNRAELLELLIAQTERADRLEAGLAEAKEQLRSREKLMTQAGDLAEAATKVLATMDGVPTAPVKPAQVDVRKAAASAPAAKPASAAKPAAKAAKSAQATKPAAKAAAAQQKVTPAKGSDSKPKLSPQQLAVLQKNRDRLTPQQLAMLKEEEALHYRAARQNAANQKQAQQNSQAQKSQRPATQAKGKTNETTGIDISAIAAITSGIGKGKI